MTAGFVFEVVIPPFLLIGAGYAIGRAGVFTREQVQGFSRFVMLFALPLLIFHSLAGSALQEIFQPRYLLVYGVASLAAYAGGYLWFRRLGGRSGMVSAVRALGVSQSNSAFIGLPMLIQIFGTAGVRPVALNMIIENLVILPLTLVLVESDASRHESVGKALAGTMRGLARTPLLLAIVAGVVFAALAISLPAPVDRTIEILAGAAAPVALISVGASLAGVSLHGKAGDIAALSFGKLVIHPLLVLLMMALLPIGDPMLRTSALLLAAMPMVSVFPMLAERGGDSETCSAALLTATALSFFTLILAVILLKPGL